MQSGEPEETSEWPPGVTFLQDFNRRNSAQFSGSQDRVDAFVGAGGKEIPLQKIVWLPLSGKKYYVKHYKK